MATAVILEGQIIGGDFPSATLQPFCPVLFPLPSAASSQSLLFCGPKFQWQLHGGNNRALCCHFLFLQPEIPDRENHPYDKWFSGAFYCLKVIQPPGVSGTYLCLKSKLLFPSSQAQMAFRDITQEDSPGQVRRFSMYRGTQPLRLISFLRWPVRSSILHLCGFAVKKPSSQLTLNFPQGNAALKNTHSPIFLEKWMKEPWEEERIFL